MILAERSLLLIGRADDHEPCSISQLLQLLKRLLYSEEVPSFLFELDTNQISLLLKYLQAARHAGSEIRHAEIARQHKFTAPMFRALPKISTLRNQGLNGKNNHKLSPVNLIDVVRLSDFAHAAELGEKQR